VSSEIPASKAPIQLLAPALWTPERYVGDSAWVEHAPFAFWLMDVLRPRNFVELGAHSGYSYFCFCQAVLRLRLGAICHAVDTWIGDEHAGFYGDEVFQLVVRHNDRYSSFSTLLRTTFDDACGYFPDRSIDLLHIDGRHYYDDVRHDFETWRAKLANDAIVLFHDVNVRERGFGVWKLFDELKRDHATFEFTHGHGLGVLAVKDIPGALRPFFALDQGSANEWRLAFASLGRNIREMGRLRQVEAQFLLLAPQALAQHHLLGGAHPVKLEKMFRRVHPDSANLFHGRSPLSEISNDLILAQSMPPGAVHTNSSLSADHASIAIIGWPDMTRLSTSRASP
jgi:hypothetical protein